MTDFIPPARPLIGDEERNAVDRVLRSGMISQGPEVAAFEKEFSAHFGLDRDCVAVNSGTSGLHVGLLASGIGRGDEVIVPSFTFAATANAVALTGATPVFADIDPDDFCLSAESVRESVTPNTKAVMAVHLYGHPANMLKIQEVADEFGLLVFEDAAQAHGASIGGKPVGAFGHFGMFSLYPTKNMTSGEGGMITVEDAEVSRRARLYRNQGMERPYHNEVVGFNYRMTDIHAAIGRVQLTKVDRWTEIRRANAEFYNVHLNGVIIPPVRDGAQHVYHQYTIRIADDRDGFARALKEEHDIGTGMFYPVPSHRLAPFRADVELPHTESAARECLSIPIHPSLTSDHLDRIVSAVNGLVSAGS